jgi:hypothetical protein
MISDAQTQARHQAQPILLTGMRVQTVYQQYQRTDAAYT